MAERLRHPKAQLGHCDPSELPSIFDTAQTVLAAHGLKGDLHHFAGGTRWVFRGELGTRGISVDIEGEPDEALLHEACRQMLEALAIDTFGR